MYRKWWVKLESTEKQSKYVVVHTLCDTYTLINLQQIKDNNGAIFHLNLFGN